LDLVNNTLKIIKKYVEYVKIKKLILIFLVPILVNYVKKYLNFIKNISKNGALIYQ